ncbi:hypothetical protein BDY21DRAFT_371924 [Lineolata rhizophorae]|uniref:Myb-like DNA-binding domain-containing protein n=1 Tax=Lineolata rhizophorae TaxID=578093 RepID=A0A6A6P029_9PEZI|nr:hypothetical protein BDY21DRAFT_371924 [Lineolata rhizophorae]
MPTDKENARLCYSMLKQQDLKTIDWKAVAAENNISNAHAARMRYSRLRTQMERSSPPPYRPRGRKPGSKSKFADEKGVKRNANDSDDSEYSRTPDKKAKILKGEPKEEEDVKLPAWFKDEEVKDPTSTSVFKTEPEPECYSSDHSVPKIGETSISPGEIKNENPTIDGPLPGSPDVKIELEAADLDAPVHRL